MISAELAHKIIDLNQTLIIGLGVLFTFVCMMAVIMWSDRKRIEDLEKNKLRKITATHKHELNTQKHGRLHGFCDLGMKGFALIEYVDGYTEELPLEKYSFIFTDKANL